MSEDVLSLVTRKLLPPLPGDGNGRSDTEARDDEGLNELTRVRGGEHWAVMNCTSMVSTSSSPSSSSSSTCPSPSPLHDRYSFISRPASAMNLRSLKSPPEVAGRLTIDELLGASSSSQAGCIDFVSHCWTGSTSASASRGIHDVRPQQAMARRSPRGRRAFSVLQCPSVFVASRRPSVSRRVFLAAIKSTRLGNGPRLALYSTLLCTTFAARHPLTNDSDA
mmetsp:Transcript_37444/g.60154  ORF Transcript_37444/g.60154 Transcript_37444/m.60154 type:complete len:222 (-) Transcript_37444:108-773(-)